VNTFPGSRSDFLPQLVIRRSRMIFVASDKSLGAGEAVVSGGLRAADLEKANGTFPLLFILFILFCLSELESLGR
jgi:hypothetical protein